MAQPLTDVLLWYLHKPTYNSRIAWKTNEPNVRLIDSLFFSFTLAWETSVAHNVRIQPAYSTTASNSYPSFR